ncbi:hypothetical protein K505DRAFT_381189 [Melanomma pulvis-pyrius CBS 109.77]|uniref:Uncharacterized protein n=1 Tax=Melanomma pulvis-pyrius CBS 109.77 TaxID=1314802 RepID=A0A6A6XJ90_9PLEO|nr:hypothetical protein K505DRAFT_381189 [Melanomma pulvis-pyrius CBS 109.77]
MSHLPDQDPDQWLSDPNSASSSNDAGKSNLELYLAESFHHQNSPSAISERLEDGDANSFQSVSAALGTPLHTDNSPESETFGGSSNISQPSSDIEDGSHQSGLSTPSNPSQQHGYERDTRAFAIKRSGLIPLKLIPSPISRRESGASLKRNPHSRLVGAVKEPPSRKGSIQSRGDTTLIPLTPTHGSLKRGRTLSLKSKYSPPIDITSEQFPSTISAEIAENVSDIDSAPASVFEYTQPGITTPKQSPRIDQRNTESLQNKKQFSFVTSIEEEFALNQSSSKLEQLKTDLQHSRSKLEEAEKNILGLKSNARKTDEEIGTMNEQFENMKKDQTAWQEEEQKLRNEIELLRGKIESITFTRAELQSEASVLSKDVKTLETENKDIESLISSSRSRLEDMESSPNANLEEFKAEMQKLRDDINAMQQAIAANTQNVIAYKAILEANQNKPNELVFLRADIRKVLGSYTSMLTDISAQNEALKVDLAKKKEEIKTLEYSIASQAKILSEEANEEFSSIVYSWQQLYEDKSKQFEKLQSRFRIFREKSIANYRPELERENKDLRARLIETQDENLRLEDQIFKLQESAANWESEYKVLQTRHQRSTQEAEQEMERLNLEMKGYVQEYKNKMPDSNPDWWDVKKLQEQVQDLERQLKDQVAAANDLKQRNVNCYREFERLKKQNEAFKVELGVEDDFKPNHNPRPKLRRPNYESEEETAKREKILKAFREKQNRDREKRERELELIEQARKYKMGERYPPGCPERYEPIRKKTVKERWEVEKFERLRDQGLFRE